LLKIEKKIVIKSIVFLIFSDPKLLNLFCRQ
jgi:hypothetical protein